MTQREFIERKEKSKKCPHCIDFFSIRLCFFNFNKDIVQESPFKINAPLCTDLKECPKDNYVKRMIEEKNIMAKNFGKVNNKAFENAEKASEEKAQVIVVKMISNENLVDYPNNREDVEDTADLENSIKQIGFIDPIEVTPFQQPDGKYMIVSGHRRRKAGTKSGVSLFPCIVKTFSSWSDIENYVLLANSQRDSAKDPLLFCKRYKMHEEYLKSINFDGKIRDEVARRLGISTPQADRYNTMNKIILPVWDMVRDETVGMTSVMPMASHSQNEQVEIYDIMQEALAKGVALTRETVKQIVFGYREGKKTWAEIADLPRDSGLPLNAFINTEPSESKAEAVKNRNDEVNREFDVISANADEDDKRRKEYEDEQLEGQTSFSDYEDEAQNHSSPESDAEEKRAKDILKTLNKLNSYFSEVYTFSEEGEAKNAIQNMTDTFSAVVDEMYNIAREYDLKSEFTSAVSELQEKLKDYV